MSERQNSQQILVLLILLILPFLINGKPERIIGNEKQRKGRQLLNNGSQIGTQIFNIFQGTNTDPNKNPPPRQNDVDDTVGTIVECRLCEDYLNSYRHAHGAAPLTKDLDYAAFEATNAVCQYGLDYQGQDATTLHQALLGECSSQEAAGVEVLKSWYKGCHDYYGQEFDPNTAFFTHMVWKSCKSFGIWAQTCNIPGTPYKCSVAFKTDCNPNWDGEYSQNVGNVGQCANVETPWGK